MANKFKFTFPIMSALILSASAAITAGVSLAGFVSVKEITQTASSGGQLGVSIYLDPGKWEVDNAIFYVYQWNSSHNSGSDANCWVSSAKKTTSGYYVFQIQVGGQYTSASDANKYTQFKFVRINPNGANVPSFDSGTLWNQTGNLTMSFSGSTLQNNDGNTNNGFRITDWGTGSWSFNVS